MTDNEIRSRWIKYMKRPNALIEFSRALIQFERGACVEACKAVQRQSISGATTAYMDGKEMAVQQCVELINERNHLPTGE